MGIRNTLAKVATIVFFFAGIGLFIGGIIINPDVQNYVSPAPQATWQSITGQTSFIFYDMYWQRNNTITVDYNITSVNFTEDSPVLVSLTMDVPLEVFQHFYFWVDIQPRNAINYFYVPPNVPYTAEPYPNPSSFNLELSSSDIWNQYWSGSQWVEFQTSGPLTLKFAITATPTAETENMTDYLLFSQLYVPYKASVVVPTVNIQSIVAVQQQQLQTQQQVDQTRNLSLTLFVLFFACVDIVVVLYDHSFKDKNEFHRKDSYIPMVQT